MAIETIRDELNNAPNTLTVGDLVELLEQHRPVKMPDRYSISGAQWIVQCRVCDKDGGKIWRDGDPPVECYQWSVVRPAVLKQFGLVEVNGIYDVVRRDVK